MLVTTARFIVAVRSDVAAALATELVSRRRKATGAVYGATVLRLMDG